MQWQALKNKKVDDSGKRHPESSTFAMEAQKILKRFNENMYFPESHFISDDTAG